MRICLIRNPSKSWRGARGRRGEETCYDNMSYNISGVWLDVDCINDSFQFDEEEGRLFLFSRFKSAFYLITFFRIIRFHLELTNSLDNRRRLLSVNSFKYVDTHWSMSMTSVLNDSEGVKHCIYVWYYILKWPRMYASTICFVFLKSLT